MKWPLTPPNNDKIYSIVSWKEILDISYFCVKLSIQARTFTKKRPPTGCLYREYTVSKNEMGMVLFGF